MFIREKTWDYSRGKRFHFLLYILPIKIYYLVVILCEKSINNMYSPLLVIKC
jgi:hypothetical protein